LNSRLIRAKSPFSFSPGEGELEFDVTPQRAD
jgi:hypothetical protein